MRSVSITDVAERAGVSLGTVSNVLNRPERVAEATRERVQRAIDELGFVRNEAARQLRAGRSRIVGMVVLDVANPFFTDMAAGAEQAAAEEGLSVFLCNTAEGEDREQHYLTLLEEIRSFGILLSPVAGGAALVQQIRDRGTPVVLVDRGGGRGECSVSVDDVAGGQLAAAHLIAQGHRRAAFVGGPMAIGQVADRLAGAQGAWRAAGLPDEDLTVLATPAMNVDSGRRAAASLCELPADRRPTAVFCANDLLALGVLQELTTRRVRVPEDVAIVGYDDISFAAAAAVPLTSLRQPRAELGRAATELLVEEAHEGAGHRHRHIVFEPELVVRTSSDAAAVGEWEPSRQEVAR